MSESERSKYYKGLPSYTELEKLRAFLVEGNIVAALDTLKASTHIHINNSYIRSHRANEWVPLIYFAFLKSEYAEFARELLRAGASVNRQPDGDTYDYLAFVCNSLYLKTLASRIRVPNDTHVLERSIGHCLNAGDGVRLKQLLVLNLLTIDQVKTYIEGRFNIIHDTLRTMIGYLTYVYSVKSVHVACNLTHDTTETIAKFAGTIGFLVNMGAQLSQQILDYCVEHYLYEIVPMVSGNLKMPVPLYHTQKNSTVTAVLRPLLNDYRYVKCCEICGCDPDMDVYNYNI